jgi:hypothetical protein
MDNDDLVDLTWIRQMCSEGRHYEVAVALKERHYRFEEAYFVIFGILPSV